VFRDKNTVCKSWLQTPIYFLAAKIIYVDAAEMEKHFL
jgi:hypothetical protein